MELARSCDTHVTCLSWDRDLCGRVPILKMLPNIGHPFGPGGSRLELDFFWWMRKRMTNKIGDKMILHSMEN